MSIFAFSPRLSEVEPRLQSVERDGSSVAERAAAISFKCVAELTPAEIAFCLRQKFALQYVLPIALTLLDEYPLVNAEFYDGDLLVALLGTQKDLELDDRQKNVLFDACATACAVVESLVENVLPEARRHIERGNLLA